MSAQATTSSDSPTSMLSPYSKFKMALKSKEVQRRNLNLLSKLLDFCKFDGLDVEENR
jgi:hypothetical protein